MVERHQVKIANLTRTSGNPEAGGVRDFDLKTSSSDVFCDMEKTRLLSRQLTQTVLNIFVVVWLISCTDKGTAPAIVDGYVYWINDSVWVYFSEETAAFADKHFHKDAYFLREYVIARIDTIVGKIQFDGSLSQWNNLTWSERREFLVPPYEYNIVTSERSSYLFLITYQEQFGFGWGDSFDNLEIDFSDTSNNRAWPNDDTLTLGFDYAPTDLLQYMAMLSYDTLGR